VPRADWWTHVQPALLYVSTLLIDVQGDYMPGDTRFARD
jgi:hypothetical protein